MPSYKTLYKTLRSTEFGCISPGFHETTDVYERVQAEYPDLCDDSIRCDEVCGNGSNQPEWKHRVDTVQQDLLKKSKSRVQKLSDGWFYAPHNTPVESAPDTASGLEVGRKYNRWELHDDFGGQRYSGIATPADHPLVFIFTGDAGEAYGYEDEFLPDDTFLYTGEGVEGDMAMEGGNAAIRHHQKANEELHVFENTEYPWIVTYVGQFSYAGHQSDTLPDKNDNYREAIRFRLEPIGGTEIEIEDGSPGSLSDAELFEKAKASSPTDPDPASTTGTGRSGSGSSYSRSDVVKEFALRDADGVCQGCGEAAPFEDAQGEPFLEVHHLHRRSDGGPDDPENVIAVCPNCHRRVHYGAAGDAFNRELIATAKHRNESFR
ncbi:HNH endonuclease [Haloarcula sp. S1CR25-12]|uniref:HNH endonuclease n=2 Tax=Haloarcula saliterrae TaxID=2950534 RepID=A0ABU2FEU9_9EURY|nr:HNH endonuclease [Haloarcula sp. S1CR25-12]